MDCPFCRIIRHQAKAKIVFENEQAVVFKDHRPQAPVHLLVCPRKHYATFMDTPPEEMAHLFKICRRLADKLKVENGFRLVVNNGPQGGQIIYHIHIHFLSWIREWDENKIDLDPV